MEITQISSITEDSFPDDAYLWAEEILESFYERTRHMMADEEYELLVSGLKYRIRNREKEYEGAIFDKVMGMYKIEVDDKVFYIEISNDPLHVLSRTTGRPGYSCEQITQHYWKGPFQDFAFRNATAYFYDKNRISLYILASTIAFSRVYVGVHYPLDIIFGSIIGYIISWIILSLWVIIKMRELKRGRKWVWYATTDQPQN